MIKFYRIYSDYDDRGLERDVWCIQIGVLKIQFSIDSCQKNNLMRALITGGEFSVPAKSVYGGIVPVVRSNTSGYGKRMMIELDHRTFGLDAECDTGLLRHLEKP